MLVENSLPFVSTGQPPPACSDSRVRENSFSGSSSFSGSVQRPHQLAFSKCDLGTRGVSDTFGGGVCEVRAIFGAVPRCHLHSHQHSVVFWKLLAT